MGKNGIFMQKLKATCSRCSGPCDGTISMSGRNGRIICGKCFDGFMEYISFNTIKITKKTEWDEIFGQFIMKGDDVRDC